MQNVAVLIREGKIEQAEAEIGKRQAESSTNPDWHCAQGLLLEAKGLGDEAELAYQHALKLDPQHAPATFRLAYYLDIHGRENEAMKLYEALAKRTPTYVNALLNLAIIYEDIGHHEKAMKCIDRVLAEHPNHTRARIFAKDIDSSMDMFYDEGQERSRQKRNALLDMPITEFELSVRSRNCLRKMNINILGDLLKISEAELLGHKNFGENSLNEIKTILTQKGLRLGQLKDENQRSRAVTRSSTADGTPEILNRLLSEIEFSSRSRKCLQRLNLITLGDLVSKTESELLAAKNFGQTSLNEIKEKLAEFGFGLRKPD